MWMSPPPPPPTPPAPGGGGGGVGGGDGAGAGHVLLCSLRVVGQGVVCCSSLALGSMPRKNWSESH